MNLYRRTALIGILFLAAGLVASFAEDDMIPEDAEPGFDAEVQPEDLSKGLLMDRVMTDVVERVNKERADDFGANAANGRVRRATQVGDSRDTIAKDRLEAGGQEAQQIQAQTSRSISGADQADSLGNVLMDAVESSIATGMSTFGETLGYGIVEESMGAPRRDDNHQH